MYTLGINLENSHWHGMGRAVMSRYRTGSRLSIKRQLSPIARPGRRGNCGGLRAINTPRGGRAHAVAPASRIAAPRRIVSPRCVSAATAARTLALHPVSSSHR